jgi:hypothetical protein
MINHNLSTIIDKLSIDYTFLYSSFDILDILGFVSRKSDAKCN